VPKNGGWEHADYDFEADYITGMNKASDGWLVPSIKMLKAIRRLYFAALRSFPMEILAAQTIPFIVNFRKVRNEQISSPDLLELFFTLAKDALSTSLKIPASNSPAIELDVATVSGLKNTFGIIEQHIRQVNQERSDAAKIDGWRQLFGDSFPTRV